MKIHKLFIFSLIFCLGSPLHFPSSEVFVLPIHHLNFSLSTPDMIYKPSLLGMPDLPPWLHYTYSPSAQSGFLYGAPPFGSKDFKIEVIAIDRGTYNVTPKTFDIMIQNEPAKANEVQFKITNLNIDEVIAPENWRTLNIILIEDLWPESVADGAIVSLTSATQKGDRLPLRPQEKEGVYVSFGSSTSFTQALKNLENEVRPLWNHRPCPTYFKKASYERFFRNKGFAIDWCSFKLHSNESDSDFNTNMDKRTEILSHLQNIPVKLMKQSEVEERSYVWDVIKTILIPLLVMLLLLALLTLAMCCHRTNMDIQSSIFFDEIFDDLPRMPTAQEIQMVHYAGMNRAVDAMRSIRGIKEKRDHSPHPSMATTTTHVDTLPRSPTASPNSTLPRNSTTPSRRFEDYATLTRPDPPPYQRNGSSRILQE